MKVILKKSKRSAKFNVLFPKGIPMNYSESLESVEHPTIANVWIKVEPSEFKLVTDSPVDQTFTVSLVFECTSGKDPLSVAKQVAAWLKKDADTFIYDVEDELTNKKFTVDLSEEDENAVLPNKD